MVYRLTEQRNLKHLQSRDEANITGPRAVFRSWFHSFNLIAAAHHNAFQILLWSHHVPIKIRAFRSHCSPPLSLCNWHQDELFTPTTQTLTTPSPHKKTWRSCYRIVGALQHCALFLAQVLPLSLPWVSYVSHCSCGHGEHTNNSTAGANRCY